jgi:hypothetical protein
MPKVPGNITVLTFTHAKGAELKYWIDGANREAGKRALTKRQGGGASSAARRTLRPQPVITSLHPRASRTTCDVEIQKGQWGHPREAWKDDPKSFRLCQKSGEWGQPVAREPAPHAH